jgi:hypothetical protein
MICLVSFPPFYSVLFGWTGTWYICSFQMRQVQGWKRWFCFGGTNFVVKHPLCSLSRQQKCHYLDLGAADKLFIPLMMTESFRVMLWLIFLSHKRWHCFCRHFWHTCMLEAIRCDIFLTHTPFPPFSKL